MNEEGKFVYYRSIIDSFIDRLRIIVKKETSLNITLKTRYNRFIGLYYTQ